MALQPLTTQVSAQYAQMPQSTRSATELMSQSVGKDAKSPREPQGETHTAQSLAPGGARMLQDMVRKRGERSAGLLG
jgi:hypothetical protein